MHRFYCGQADLDRKIIDISDLKEIHHLRNVLRLKLKDQIKIFNNLGEEIVATVVSMTVRSIQIRKDYDVPALKQKEVEIVLACAIPKKAKFESIIEKCTELGVDQIIPVITQRTVVVIPKAQIPKKNLRLESK